MKWEYWAHVLSAHPSPKGRQSAELVVNEIDAKQSCSSPEALWAHSAKLIANQLSLTVKNQDQRKNHKIKLHLNQVQQFQQLNLQEIKEYVLLCQYLT